MADVPRATTQNFTGFASGTSPVAAGMVHRAGFPTEYCLLKRSKLLHDKENNNQ